MAFRGTESGRAPGTRLTKRARPQFHPVIGVSLLTRFRPSRACLTLVVALAVGQASHDALAKQPGLQGQDQVALQALREKE